MAELTPEFCQDVCVRNTPNPDQFDDPDQILKDLGVIDGNTTRAHKAGVQDDLRSSGWQIKQDDIKSSPTTKVADCRDSLLERASAS